MKKTILTVAIGLAMGLVGINLVNDQSVVEASSIESNSSVFGDACRNVKFSFKNKHSQNGQIQILKVEYFNKANGRWQTEQVPNTVIPQNTVFTTNGDNLRDSEGEDITKVKFHFKWKSNTSGAQWSSAVVSPVFVPSVPECNANRTYGGADWEITG